MSRNSVKHHVVPGAEALNSRRKVALKNIEKHLEKILHIESEIERHKKEVETLKNKINN